VGDRPTIFEMLDKRTENVSNGKDSRVVLRLCVEMYCCSLVKLSSAVTIERVLVPCSNYAKGIEARPLEIFYSAF
jgi:hypothetical protein